MNGAPTKNEASDSAIASTSSTAGKAGVPTLAMSARKKPRDSVAAKETTATHSNVASIPNRAQKAFSATSLKSLSLSRVTQIAYAARDGKAEPAEVREVLALFYRHAEAKTPIPQRVVEFVAEAFGRYLGLKDFYGPDERSANSLDSAFGLLRKKGRPEADEQTRRDMAVRVVELRLSGISHQEALERAAKDFGWARTIIGKAFRDHTLSAVMMIRNARQTPFSPDEKRLLARMLRHQPKIEFGKITD
jgi:hypothetical protein